MYFRYSPTLLFSRALLTRPSAAAMGDEQQVWQHPVREHFQGHDPSGDPKHPGANINIGRDGGRRREQNKHCTK